MLPLLLLLFSPVIESIVRSPESNDELLLVQIVIRHADRAPLYAYATNKSADVFYRGLGELSDEGIDNAYKQGEAYRKRYVDTGFVDERMVPSELFIRSSAVPRVLMSAASFTSALFNQTDSGMNKVPPIFTKEKDTDPLLVPPLYCLDGWEDVVEKYGMESPRDAEKARREKQKLTGLPVKKKHGQALKAMLAREMPEDCKMVPPELIESIVAELPNPQIELPDDWLPCAQNGAKKLIYKYMGMLAGAGEDFNLHRLRRTVGLLTAELIDNMKKRISAGSNATDPKFRVYYTHDINVLALSYAFDAIDLFQGKTPAYSSSLVFELRKGKEGPYVQIFLKNGEKAEFVESDRCVKDCSLDAVEKLVSGYAIHEPAACEVYDEASSSTGFPGGSSTTTKIVSTTTKGVTTHSSCLALLFAMVTIFSRL